MLDKSGDQILIPSPTWRKRKLVPSSYPMNPTLTFSTVCPITHTVKRRVFLKKKKIWPDVIIHTFNASTGRQRQVIFTDSWTAWPTREFQVSQCFKDFDVFKHR